MQRTEAQRLAGALSGGRTRPSAERLAPLTGFAVPVLALAGLIVLEGPADRPEVNVAAGAFVRYFGDRDTVLLGSFLLMLSVVFFLWFLGSLRAVLRRAEGDVGRLSAVAYGGGLTTAVLLLALPAVSVLGALDAEQFSPQGAKTAFLIGDAFLYPSAMTAAVLVGATALVVLQTGALPRWLGWLSAAFALWLLIPPLGSGGGTPENPAAWSGLAALLGVPLWTALTAGLIMRSRDD